MLSSQAYGNDNAPLHTIGGPPYLLHLPHTPLCHTPYSLALRPTPCVPLPLPYACVPSILLYTLCAIPPAHVEVCSGLWVIVCGAPSMGALKAAALPTAQ